MCIFDIDWLYFSTLYIYIRWYMYMYLLIHIHSYFHSQDEWYLFFGLGIYWLSSCWWDGQISNNGDPHRQDFWWPTLTARCRSIHSWRCSTTPMLYDPCVFQLPRLPRLVITCLFSTTALAVLIHCDAFTVSLLKCIYCKHLLSENLNLY